MLKRKSTLRTKIRNRLSISQKIWLNRNLERFSPKKIFISLNFWLKEINPPKLTNSKQNRQKKEIRPLQNRAYVDRLSSVGTGPRLDLVTNWSIAAENDLPSGKFLRKVLSHKFSTRTAVFNFPDTFSPTDSVLPISHPNLQKDPAESIFVYLETRNLCEKKVLNFINKKHVFIWIPVKDNDASEIHKLKNRLSELEGSYFLIFEENSNKPRKGFFSNFTVASSTSESPQINPYFNDLLVLLDDTYLEWVNYERNE